MAVPQHPQTILDQTDKDTIRIVEDLIDLLITKGLILESDLPVEAQERLQLRKDQRALIPAEIPPPVPPATST